MTSAPAATVPKAHFPHFVDEGNGRLVLSEQGHHIPEMSPAQYRGKTVTKDGDWKESVQGVFDNLQRALQQAGKSPDLSQLSKVYVYFVEGSSIPQDELELFCMCAFNPGAMLSQLIPVDALPGDNIVEIEGEIAGDKSAQFSLFCITPYSTDLDTAVKEAFSRAKRMLVGFKQEDGSCLSLSNVSYVRILLNNTSLFDRFNALWNALFKDGSKAPARTTIFASDIALAQFIFRASPNVSRVIDESLL